jgi:hypothetical protein
LLHFDPPGFAKQLGSIGHIFLVLISNNSVSTFFSNLT